MTLTHVQRHTRATLCNPEVVLNNFTTRVGHIIARMLAAVFPHDPQFTARRVVTFHNQRDFIFFRQHRYHAMVQVTLFTDSSMIDYNPSIPLLSQSPC